MTVAGHALSPPDLLIRPPRDLITGTTLSLRSLPGERFAPGCLVFVDENKSYYGWDAASTADSPPDVIVPNVTVGGRGRWVLLATLNAEAEITITETVLLASTSRLVDIDTTALPDGSRVYVNSVEDTYTFDRTSVLAADGLLVAVPVVGPGRWLRLSLGSERWRHQATWFVHATTGNDENDGSTLGTAIQTKRELFRRLSKGEIPQTIDVTYPVSIPATDTAFLYGVTILPNAMIRFHGTPTVVHSGTIDAATNLDSATQTPPSFTDASVGDFAPHIGRRVRLTSGPFTGAFAFLSLRVAATTARTSAWFTNNLLAAPYGTAVTLVNPTAGTTYVIETLPSDAAGAYLVEKMSEGAQGSTAILWDSLEIGYGGNSRISTHFPNVAFAACIWNSRNFYGRNISFSGVRIRAGDTLHIETLVCRACSHAAPLSLRKAAQVELRDQCLAQGATSIMNVVQNSFIEVFAAAAFDGTEGIVIDQDSRARFNNLVATPFWGTGQTGFGIRVDGQANYSAGMTPTCTGAAGDTRIGGTVTAYGALPFLNAANGASLVVRAS